jgi:ATP-binding cassette subfamily B protein/ATP-binding cassette subfamily C protein
MPSSHEEILLEENEKNERDINTFKRLWKYIKDYKMILFVAFLTLFFAAIIDLALPYFIKYGIDNYITIEYKFNYNQETQSFEQDPEGIWVYSDKNDRNILVNSNTDEVREVDESLVRRIKNENIEKITTFSLIFLSILLLGIFFNYGQVYFSNLLGQKVIYRIRSDLFEHITKVQYKFFTQNPTGKITTRIVNDTQNLSEFFSEVLSSLLKDIAIIIGVVILIFTLNIRLSLYTVITFPIVIVALYFFRIFDRKAYDRVRTRISIVNSYLAENISGSNVTTLFNQEKRKKNEFDKHSTNLYRARIQQMYVFAIFRPAMNFLYFLTLSILLWFGSQGVREGFATFGTLYAFTSYVQMFFRPLMNIAEKYDIMQNAFASAGKIFRLFETKHEYLGKGIKKDMEKGEIEFKNVHFSYNVEEEKVLRGVNFSIKSTDRVSIVGETGSGKTTMIKLMSGLYEIDEGEIYFDGTPLYDYDLDSLRQKIAVVPQDVFLFSGNIIDNIRLFNRDISVKEVINASKEVNAHDIIEKLPEGYNTEILERGGTLSSGERQLIALARAVLFNAKIIILDEATASIDVQTEDLIQKALDKIADKKTIISIAHRLSTVKSSNKILVVHKGLIVEEGSHNQLIEKRGVYYDLYKLQFEN